MKRTLTKEILCGQSMRISRIEYDAEPARFEAMAERDMRLALADFIQRAKVETKKGEFYVEKRLDLYVATPDQFWEFVHREANEIAMRYGLRPPKDPE